MAFAEIKILQYHHRVNMSCFARYYCNVLTEIMPILILAYHHTMYQYERDTSLQSNDWQSRRMAHRYVKLFVNMDYSLLGCTSIP